MTTNKSLRSCLFTLLFSFWGLGNLCAQFSGGTGAKSDPYQVSGIQQLQDIQNHLDKHFILINDIDAEPTSSWNKGEGFKPVGTDSLGFSGHFNGQGFSISNLHIKRPEEEYIGLFGKVDNGVIVNLKLKEVRLNGANHTGGIAGRINKGSVSYTSVTGQISGRTHVGGISGFNRGNIEYAETEVEITGRSYVGGIAGINRGKINRSNASVMVTGTGHNLGGLVGNNYDGLISESTSQGSVSGEKASSVGGLSGSNGGRIVRSYTGASVNGKSYVGGFVGNNHSGQISWSYATGKVTGFHLVGGFAGVNRKNGAIQEVYSTGNVEGTIDVGGFIGVNRDPIRAGYWVNDSSETKPVSTGTQQGITGLSSHKSSGLQSPSVMNDLSFDTEWGAVPEKYPQHLWTIPYFVISYIHGDTSLISGDLAVFELKIENAGAYADTQSVAIHNGEGNILSKSDDLLLSSGQDTTLSLLWQTSTNDKGVFDLLFKTHHYKKRFPLKLRRIPDIVQLVTPFGLEEHVKTTPQFVWKNAFLAESYDLQIADNEDFDPVLINISGIDTSSYSLSEKLNHLSYYHWRVRGVNTDEKGPWSEASEFITIIERPEVVELKLPVNEQSEASTQPTFEWSETDRAEKYRIQVSADDEFEKVVFDSSFTAIDSSLTLKKTLAVKQPFYWRIQASNIGGQSDWSETRSFIPIKQSSKYSDFDKLDYTLEQNYPNPFNPITYIRYSIPEPTRVQIEVLNMLGQNVATLEDDYKSAGWHTVTFDASDLSSGFYIYRIKTEEFTTSRKLSLVK